jgi:hypothetical protein
VVVVVTGLGLVLDGLQVRGGRSELLVVRRGAGRYASDEGVLFMF